MQANNRLIIQKTLKVFLQLLPLLAGAVFVFSGFVKAIDPIGFSYKISDYLNAFGGVFRLLPDFALPFAILLSVCEMLIGLGLFFRIFIKPSVVAALLLMLVMTPLTLYIALTNPVSDCGCFGDALIISNWETFYKNLVISALLVMIFFNLHQIKPLVALKTQKVIFGGFILISFGLSQYCLTHLPLIDFLPYKINVNIPEAMVIPEDAPSDEYLTTFIYEKNGVQKEFTLENYPQDTTWKFIDQKSVLIKQGYKPPIHDFNIMNSQLEDITESVLYADGYCYLLVMYDINKSSIEGLQNAERLYQIAKSKNVPFYALTGSSDDDVARISAQTKVTFPFFKTDPTALKTIIRANPGLVLLNKGTVVGKWNWRDIF